MCFVPRGTFCFLFEGQLCSVPHGTFSFLPAGDSRMAFAFLFFQVITVFGRRRKKHGQPMHAACNHYSTKKRLETFHMEHSRRFLQPPAFVGDVFASNAIARNTFASESFAGKFFTCERSVVSPCPLLPCPALWGRFSPQGYLLCSGRCGSRFLACRLHAPTGRSLSLRGLSTCLRRSFSPECAPDIQYNPPRGSPRFPPGCPRFSSGQWHG